MIIYRNETQIIRTLERLAKQGNPLASAYIKQLECTRRQDERDALLNEIVQFAAGINMAQGYETK